ncbi:MAG: hypothetical protein B6D65_05810 [candidate division Zixibacteria bacterium 4484_93]|nr:MAG: hypothetical protein B6D65_05810 [candidate division Zixibacteria bacterium 4484_93]
MFPYYHHFREEDWKREMTDKLVPEELDVLRKVAKKVTEWKMAVPAILILEMSKPVNFVSSQLLLFLEPYVQLFLTSKDFSLFRSALSKRESIEKLLEFIEEEDNIKKVEEQERRKRGKRCQP